MTEAFPGIKTWLIALLTTFWTYRKTRHLAIDVFFKTIRRLLMTLPHARRTQIIKYILGRPTLQSRRLLTKATLPHGSQWNHIAALEPRGTNRTHKVKGHWYFRNIYHQGHSYAEKALANIDMVILYIHGGGFRVGSSTMYSDTYLHWLDRLQHHDIHGAVLSLEYDLAPEVHWHTMMDQAEQAYLYLLALGVPSSKVIIGGDSAGGFITGMLLPRLHAHHHPMPLGGILVSPLVTFDKSAPSYTKHAAFDCLPESMMQQELADLFPELHEQPGDVWRQQCLANVSPILADLTGCPPLLVAYGQRERFANDVERYVAHASKFVDVHVVSRHSEPHVYVVTPLLASSLRAWAADANRVADWCSQRIKQSDAY